MISYTIRENSTIVFKTFLIQNKNSDTSYTYQGNGRGGYTEVEKSPKDFYSSTFSFDGAMGKEGFTYTTTTVCSKTSKLKDKIVTKTEESTYREEYTYNEPITQNTNLEYQTTTTQECQSISLETFDDKIKICNSFITSTSSIFSKIETFPILLKTFGYTFGVATKTGYEDTSRTITTISTEPYISTLGWKGTKKVDGYQKDLSCGCSSSSVKIDVNTSFPIDYLILNQTVYEITDNFQYWYKTYNQTYKGSKYFTDIYSLIHKTDLDKFTISWLTDTKLIQTVEGVGGYITTSEETKSFKNTHYVSKIDYTLNTKIDTTWRQQFTNTTINLLTTSKDTYTYDFKTVSGPSNDPNDIGDMDWINTTTYAKNFLSLITIGDFSYEVVYSKLATTKTNSYQILQREDETIEITSYVIYSNHHVGGYFSRFYSIVCGNINYFGGVLDPNHLDSEKFSNNIYTNVFLKDSKTIPITFSHEYTLCSTNTADLDPIGGYNIFVITENIAESVSDLGLSYLPRLTIPVLQLCPTFLSKDTTFNASFLSRVQFSYTKTETISNSTRETSTAQPAYWDVDGRLPLKEFTNIEVVNSRYFRFSQYDDYDYYDYYLNPINYNFINKKNGFCNKGGICNISKKYYFNLKSRIIYIM